MCRLSLPWSRSIALLYLSITLARSQSMTWLREMAWTVTANLFCLLLRIYWCFACKPLHRFMWLPVDVPVADPKALSVSPMQVLSQFLHGILYTHSQASWCPRLSFGCTSRWYLEWFYGWWDTMSFVNLLSYVSTYMSLFKDIKLQYSFQYEEPSIRIK